MPTLDSHPDQGIIIIKCKKFQYRVLCITDARKKSNFTACFSQELPFHNMFHSRNTISQHVSVKKYHFTACFSQELPFHSIFQSKSTISQHVSVKNSHFTTCFTQEIPFHSMFQSRSTISQHVSVKKYHFTAKSNTTDVI